MKSELMWWKMCWKGCFKHKTKRVPASPPLKTLLSILDAQASYSPLNSQSPQ